MRIRRVLFTLMLLAMTAGASQAGSITDRSSAGFSPLVPVSAFAHPASWLDMSRLHVSSMVSVGSGFTSGTNALQVTSLSYQFAAPVWMRVSVGNAWGPGNANASGGNSFFLEGVDLGWHPTPNMTFQVQFQNVRSPLQQRPYGYWGY